MPHHCPIPHCCAEIKPWALLCRTHWSMVPKPMQDAVNHYNRYFKGKPIHVKACRNAIENVMQTLDARQREIDAKAPPKPELKPSALPYRDD